MHIKNIRVDFAVRTDYTVANYLYYVRRGVSALIRGVIRSSGKLPYLERVQVTHNGVSMYRRTRISNALDIMYDLNLFTELDDFQFLMPLGRPSVQSHSFFFMDKNLLRPTEPGTSQWATEFECRVSRARYKSDYLVYVARKWVILDQALRTG